MPRRLDHIVHAVRDLDAAADLYARLGFAVGARNRHPWGTHNRLVQVSGFFIELLEVAEPDRIPPPAERSFSFGAFNQSFLATVGEGFSMLAFGSDDAAGDAERFRHAGISQFDLFRFEREGQRPDGSVVRLAFSLAFTSDPKAPDAGFFVCQHHSPENLWGPAFQGHANTANRLERVVMVAASPADHHAFLSAMTAGPGAAPAAGAESGAIEMIDPATFRERYGVDPPDVSRGARFAAVHLGLAQPAVLPAATGGAVPMTEHAGLFVVGPEAARGAILVFS
jgi:hypothetical protein